MRFGDDFLASQNLAVCKRIQELYTRRDPLRIREAIGEYGVTPALIVWIALGTLQFRISAYFSFLHSTHSGGLPF